MNSSDDIKLWKNITSSDMKILLLSIRNSDIRSIHLDIIEEILCELVNRYVNYSIELDRLGDYYLIFDDDMLLYIILFILVGRRMEYSRGVLPLHVITFEWMI